MHGNDTLTHAQLHQQAARWLTCLQTHGVKPREPIVVWSASPNTVAAAYLAIVSLRAVYVPVHAATSMDQVMQTCAGLGARLVLCTPGQEPGLPAADLNFQPPDAELVSGLRAAALCDPDADLSAHIFHTSGSTGVAKPIHVSHRALPAIWLGGTCVVHDGKLPPSATQLLEALQRHRISTLYPPTAYFHALCDQHLPACVKRWIVGGEALAR